MKTEGKQNNLRLRAMESTDIAFIRETENDPSQWLHTGLLYPYSEETLNKFVHATVDFYADRQIRLMIEHQNGICTGIADIFCFDPMHSRAAVGIFIHPEYRRKGFAKEALDLLCEYAFGVLQIHQLYAEVATDNIESLRLFSSSDFIECGTRKHWYRRQTLFTDQKTFQIFNPYEQGKQK